MKYDLAAMTRRVNNPRRSAIVIRDMVPPATLATNLYLSAYKPMVDLWGRRADAIAVEYARTLAAMTTDSPADLQAQLDAAQSETERLIILLNAAVSDWAVSTEKWQREKWRAAVLSATGVDLQTVLGAGDVRQTLETSIRWNVSLVRNVSDQARQRIEAAVFSGLHQNAPAADVAREIRDAVGMARDRSRRIAADQLSKLTSALADERRRDAGIDVWKWKHSGKLHPRKWHRARDGHLYGEGDMPGHEVGGQIVDAPPAADDLPGRPPFCGCRSQAVLVLD
jgi:uncharacterized protein with gpF-like domain